MSSSEEAWILHLSEDAKHDYEFMKNGVMNEVKQIFRPEFLNRIDETLVFHTLQKDEITQIAGTSAAGAGRNAAKNQLVHSGASFTEFCDEMAG